MGYTTPEAVMNGWYDSEEIFWNYGTHSGSGGVTGHFTQVICLLCVISIPRRLSYQVFQRQPFSPYRLFGGHQPSWAAA